MRFALLVILALAAAPNTAALAQDTVPGSLTEMQLSFAPVVKQTAPAVVNVYAKLPPQQMPSGGLFNDPLFREFFGDRMGQQPQRAQASLGSGVIVDPKGLVVTNFHVIKGGTDIRVVLADKREFVAKVMLADERTDLAVLKIDAQDVLPSLPLANSDNLEVGDLVLAIGNPFGVGQTVTSGIVSALARTDVGISDYQFFIQTDAAINPGNSGGALVNMAGQVVGINSSIYSKSGGSIGIGFAIPANMVKTVVQSAEQGKQLRRPWIGADMQDVTADIADSLGFARPEGALIAKLYDQSPLAAAGLQRGDVVLAFEGKPVESAKELNYRVATAEVGSAAIVEFVRKGEKREAKITLIAAPETVARDETLIEGNTPLAGMVAANLSPAVADELGLPASASGVVATKIANGPARRFLRPGDIVVSVNGIDTPDVASLQQVLSENNSYWQITLNRGGRTINLTISG